MTQLTVGSLFSGIGGLELGLERAGMRTIWQCESDKYARQVLAKHWPNIPVYEDVRLIDDRVDRPDVLCGGFPCQDLSCANIKAKGLEGERSGLWFEYYRIICLLRPRYVVVENGPVLVNRGLNRILGQLAEVGYDAEWQVLSAAQFGAPHLRRRLFVVAYTQGEQNWGIFKPELQSDIGTSSQGVGVVSNTDSPGCLEQCGSIPIFPEQFTVERSDWWSVKPDVGKLANGVPNRVGKLRCLGNAVVPQIAEYIGRLIVEREAL